MVRSMENKRKWQGQRQYCHRYIIIISISIIITIIITTVIVIIIIIILISILMLRSTIYPVSDSNNYPLPPPTVQFSALHGGPVEILPD